MSLPLQVCELGQQLDQGKAQCEGLLRADRLAVEQYFQELELTLRRKKEACLVALEAASADVDRAYNPLIVSARSLAVGPGTLETRDAPPKKFRPPKNYGRKCPKSAFSVFGPKYFFHRNYTAETEICDDANKKRGPHTLVWISANMSAVWTFSIVSEKDPRIVIGKNCNAFILITLIKLVHSHSHKCNGRY
jgi:hypothetical protein